MAHVLFQLPGAVLPAVLVLSRLFNALYGPVEVALPLHVTTGTARRPGGAGGAAC